jgi:hypothetical protein
MSFLRMDAQVCAGRSVDQLHAESASRRGSTVTGTENSSVLASTCASSAGDAADRNAAELDRRTGREPADRLLEDEPERLRIARGQLVRVLRGRRRA